MENKRSLRRDDSLRVFLQDKEFLVRALQNRKLVRLRSGPPVKVISFADKLLHRSTGPSIQKYYTQGHKLKKIRDITNEPSPYEVPPVNVLGFSAVKEEKEKTKERNAEYEKHYMVPTFRSRGSCDILERLYIPEMENNPKGIRDLFPDYYSMIKGRPIKSTSNKTTYISSINNTFRSSIMKATFEDRIIFSDVQYVLNFKCVLSLYEYYEKADILLEGFMNSEEKYMLDMMETFNIIMNMNLDQVDKLREAKVATLDEQNEVEHAFSLLSTRAEFKHMLYELSPSSWKKEYDERKARDWLPEDIDAYAEISEIYEEYLDKIDEPNLYFVNLVMKTKSLISTIGPHAMYFKSMHELEDVMKNLEEQVVLAVESLGQAVHNRKVFNTKVKETKKYFKSQKKILQDSINMLKKGTEFNLDRVNDLNKRLHRKVDTWFKEVIVGEETMMINSLIICMYDEIVGNRTSVMTFHEMIEALEGELIKLWVEIQSIGKKNMKQMTESMRLKEQRAVELALKVKKKDDMLKILLKQMERAYAPVHLKIGKKPKLRSRPPKQADIKKSSKKAESKSKIKMHIPVEQEESEDCQMYYNAPGNDFRGFHTTDNEDGN